MGEVNLFFFMTLGGVGVRKKISFMKRRVGGVSQTVNLHHEGGGVVQTPLKGWHNL